MAFYLWVLGAGLCLWGVEYQLGCFLWAAGLLVESADATVE